jgi:glycerol-3-phosphate acyltransferase PlsY
MFEGILIAIVTGYLLGSIPSAYWLGLAVYRLNIFEHGSKNMGATNVFRVLGKVPFAITLALDVLKGMMAVIITAKLAPTFPPGLFIAAGAAICGHTLSFWVKFKGGKGVATGLGIFLALATKASISSLLVFIVTLIVSGMVSLGSILAAISLPVFIFIFKEGGPIYNVYLTGFAALVAIFIVYKHKANIHRIIKGEELAIGAKKDSKKTEPTTKSAEK